jgi:hypothetical protein
MGLLYIYLYPERIIKERLFFSSHGARLKENEFDVYVCGTFVLRGIS